MKNVKILLLSILLLLVNFSKQAFAQQNLETNRTLIEYNYFNISDSVRTESIVYYNSTFYKVAKTGLIAGAVGAGVTILTIGGIQLAKEHNSCDMGCAILVTTVPVAVGVISLITASTIQYLTMDEPTKEFTNYPYPQRSFNQIGFIGSVHESVNAASYDMIKLGFTYRNLNKFCYLPNKISLLYGGGYGFDNNYSVYTSNLSIEALNINYNKPFSWIYGVELGVTFADATSENGYMQFNEDGTSEYIITNTSNIKKTLPFFDFVFGFNINFFSWLSFDASYKLEPYGINNLFGSDKLFRHKIGFSTGVYF